MSLCFKTLNQSVNKIIQNDSQEMEQASDVKQYRSDGIEIIPGIYTECGDGSADCLDISGYCAVIFTEETKAHSGGNTYTYIDVTFNKIIGEDTIPIDYDSLHVTFNNNQQGYNGCDANSNAHIVFYGEQ